MEWSIVGFAAITGYLLGSISNARLMRWAVNPRADVSRIVEEMPGGREFVSDSVSATAARVHLGTRYGCLTGLLDMAKVGVPVAAWLWWSPDQPVYALVSAGAGHLGHVFPLYHRFFGGRGESAVFGALLVIDPVGVVVTNLAGTVLGMAIGHVLVLRWAGLLLMIPWMAWRFDGHAHLVYILFVNALYWWAMVPELRQYVVFLREGVHLSQEEIAGRFAMGRGLGRVMDRYSLLGWLDRRKGGRTA